MIPVPGKTLTDIALRVATSLAPAASNNYAAADAGIITGLLLTLAQDYERSIDSPMQDIAEIKLLCAELLSLPEDTLEDFDGAPACLSFIDVQPASFKLADVTTLHAQALKLLIDIHTWAELHDEGINLQVWQLLRRHSERNKFDIPGP